MIQSIFGSLVTNLKSDFSEFKILDPIWRTHVLEIMLFLGKICMQGFLHFLNANPMSNYQNSS